MAIRGGRCGEMAHLESARVEEVADGEDEGEELGEDARRAHGLDGGGEGAHVGLGVGQAHRHGELGVEALEARDEARDLHSGGWAGGG